MAKVLFYRVTAGRTIHLERAGMAEDPDILSVLNSNSVSETDSTVFLNNKKTKDLKQELKKNDLLFVFIND